MSVRPKLFERAWVAIVLGILAFVLALIAEGRAFPDLPELAFQMAVGAWFFPLMVVGLAALRRAWRNQRTLTRVYSWMALLTVFSQCSQLTRPVENKSTVESPAKAVAPTDEQARVFAKNFRDAIVAGDLKAASGMQDSIRIMQRATAGLHVSDATVKHAAEDFAKSGGARPWIDAVKANGRFDVVRIEHDPDGCWVRFRLINEGGGFEYVRLLLDSTANGVRWVDMEMTSFGYRLSQGSHGLMAHLASQARGSRAEEARHTALLSPMAEAKRLLVDGKLVEANKALDRLPAALQASMLVLSMRVQIVLADPERNRADHEAAIDALLKAYPNQATRLMHDSLLAEASEEWEASATALEKLNELVGPDAYALLLRAHALLKLERTVSARRAMAQAAALDPDMPDLQMRKLEMALVERNFMLARDLLLVLENTHHWKIQVPLLPNAEAFVRSPAFLEYLGRTRNVQK